MTGGFYGKRAARAARIGGLLARAGFSILCPFCALLRTGAGRLSDGKKEGGVEDERRSELGNAGFG